MLTVLPEETLKEPKLLMPWPFATVPVWTFDTEPDVVTVVAVRPSGTTWASAPPV